MRVLFLLATEQDQPVPLDDLRDDFDDVSLVPAEGAWGFRFGDEGTPVEVRFAAETPDLAGLTGSEAALAAAGRARGVYRVVFSPGGPQPVEAVLDALYCASAVLGRAGGVLVDPTTRRVLEADAVAETAELDFDVRDHVAVEARPTGEGLAVRTLGMAKFGAPDVAIAAPEGERLAAEWFLYDLCTETAFGQGPPPRTEVRTPEGQVFSLRPAEEAGVEAVPGHLLVVSAPAGVAALLAPHRERLAPEPADRTAALRREAEARLPAFAARFADRAPGDRLAFLVRAAFETHPEGGATTEHLWLEVVDWEEGTLVGRLVDGSLHTAEWHRGAHVEVDEGEIEALALEEEGARLDAAATAARLGGAPPR